MGGWNKGIKNSTGSAFKDKKHTEETKEKLKNRPKECYKKPQAAEYIGTELCNYGCGQPAKYQFKAGKMCCSTSHNSCPKKRKDFSDLDHTERSRKSLLTRISTGVTLTSRKKAQQTMLENGTYNVIAEKNRKAWERRPWNNQGPRGEWVLYKNTEIAYQGSYEFIFLEVLENKNSIEWLKENVRRGPSIWYIDPMTQKKRLYISDYIIGNTIYEIKSLYTWNKKGKDLDLENLNRAKLNECLAQGYKVVLVLDKKDIEYA
mgnify:CR=1 FL=1